MMLGSLRWRLALGTGMVSALFFTGAIAASYSLIRQSLVSEFDVELREKALIFANEIKDKYGESGLLSIPRFPKFGEQKHKEFAQLWDASGRSIARVPQWEGASLDSHLRPKKDGVDVVLPNGGQGRQVVVSFDCGSPGSARTLVLAVAQDNTLLENTLRRIFRVLALCGVVAALGTMLAATAVISSLLSPVRRLVRELEGMDQDDLSSRLEVARMPGGLQPVLRGLNDLMARLDTAFEREKSMTADLAHELRTPLHGLLLTLEVALSKKREAAQYRQTLEECLAMVASTQAMAQNLMVLARLDADHRAAERDLRPVPVLSLLKEIWGPLAPQARAKGLTLSWEGQETLLLTDADRLRLALANLMGNAVHHTPEGGGIRISLGRQGDASLLEIANSGSQVSAEDASRVFDRFWRQDAARTQDGFHFGLGMAIVKRALDLLRIPVQVTSETGGWFKVALTFGSGSIASR